MIANSPGFAIPCEPNHTASKHQAARPDIPQLLAGAKAMLGMSLACAMLLMLTSFPVLAEAQDSPIIIGQDNYTKAMDRLVDEYAFGDYTSAMRDAQIVLSFAPRDSRAYYYMALIELSREHPDEAIRDADRALRFSRAISAQSIQHLIASATAMADSLPLRDQAEADDASGLYAKAAREFERAYLIDPAKWSLGAAAANLYVALGDIPDSAYVMRRIAADDNPDASYIANRWLLESAELIQQASDSLTERANKLVEGDLLWKADRAARDLALSDYAEALKAQPQCKPYKVCAWMLLDRVKAFNGDAEAVKSDFKIAAASDLTIDADSFHYFHDRNGRREEVYDGAWVPLLCEPSFVHFLSDVFGNDAAISARDTCLQIPAANH